MDSLWKASDHEEAKRLLEHSILPRVFDAVKTEIVEEWEGTAPENTAAREALYAEARGLDRIQAYLQGMVSDLEVAAARDEEG